MDEIGEIEEFVVQTVAEVAELSEEEVWDKRHRNIFQEVGLDSLLALEIIANLEDHYRIEVPGDRLVEIATVAGAISLVKDMVGPERTALAS